MRKKIIIFISMASQLASLGNRGYADSVVAYLYFCFAEKKINLLQGVNHGSRKSGSVDVCHKG